MRIFEGIESRLELMRALLRRRDVFPERIKSALEKGNNFIAARLVVYGVTPGVIAPADAAPILQRLRSDLIERLLYLTSPWPAHRWMWYFRRLRRAWSLERKGVFSPFALAVAEAASRFGKKRLITYESLKNGEFLFPIDESDLGKLLDVISTAQALEGMSSASRFVAAGGSCLISKEFQILPVQNDAFSAALKLDGERRLPSMFFPGVGTALFHDRIASFEDVVDTDDMSTPSFVTLFAALENAEHVTLPPIFLPAGRKDQGIDGMRIAGNYAETRISLQDLARTNQLGVEWWTSDQLLRLMLLHQMTPLVYHPRGMRDLMMFGYITLPREKAIGMMSPGFAAAKKRFAEFFPSNDLPESAEIMFDRASLISPSKDLSMRGRPILCTAKDMMIDMSGLTQDIQVAAQYPASQGDVANYRSGDFERQVQDAINRSLWKPNPDLEQYRGRHLRVAGRPFSEIDALGVRDSTLLLVSCKSVILGPDYPMGDFKSMRNYASMVEAAIQKWKEVIDTIQKARVGDNYDFTAFQTIVGVVCTSSLVYVPIGSATAFVAKDLRTAVSINELIEWLNTPRS